MMFPRGILFLPLLSASASARTPIKPSHESAKANAAHIFNEIHSAGRQWGSSIHINGFGLFPAVVPKGTLLYHGTNVDYPPKGPEWLAFEIEHSEMFTPSFRVPGEYGMKRSMFGDDDGEDDTADASASMAAQKVLMNKGASRWSSDKDNGEGDEDKDWNIRGYMHTYRANRDLKVLYVDGQSAATCCFGTGDSQDYILRGEDTCSGSDYWTGELTRVKEICELITDWGLDGFVRLEVGFELVMCDFSKGIDLMSVTRTFMPDDKLGDNHMKLYQLVRAVGKEYDGLGDMLKVDFSGMVSGLFFPINISSTDPERPDMIRLGAADQEELTDIRLHLEYVLKEPRKVSVNWQAVVDAVVNRYAEAIELLVVKNLDTRRFLNELDAVTMVYFDAPPLPDDGDANVEKEMADEAIDRCAEHLLLPVQLDRVDWSLEDDLIHTSISAITNQICQTLITAATSLQASKTTARTTETDPLSETIAATRGVLKALMDDLDWAEWKRTRPCPIGQVWFVAMFPFGDEKDHEEPGCRTVEEMEHPRMGYWFPPGFAPPDDDDDDVDDVS